MPALVLQRCLHHPEREAVARCPECERFFCRECIAEHDDRVICASCLQRLAQPKEEPRRRLRLFSGLLPVGNALLGLLVAWICFYMVGRLLLTLPSEFHSDLWNSWWSQMED